MSSLLRMLLPTVYADVVGFDECGGRIPVPRIVVLEQAPVLFFPRWLSFVIGGLLGLGVGIGATTTLLLVQRWRRARHRISTDIRSELPSKNSAGCAAVVPNAVDMM